MANSITLPKKIGLGFRLKGFFIVKLWVYSLYSIIIEEDVDRIFDCKMEYFLIIT